MYIFKSAGGKVETSDAENPRLPPYQIPPWCQGHRRLQVEESKFSPGFYFVKSPFYCRSSLRPSRETVKKVSLATDNLCKIKYWWKWIESVAPWLMLTAHISGSICTKWSEQTTLQNCAVSNALNNSFDRIVKSSK